MSTHIIFGLQFITSNIFRKALEIVFPFLFHKGVTHAYLLQKSVTHNKNWNCLLYLLINCISARLAPQILSKKRECTFLLFTFQINGLCNSSTNSLLEIF